MPNTTLNSGARRVARGEHDVLDLYNPPHFPFELCLCPRIYKTTLVEGNCLDVPNTPQSIFNFVYQFFRHHTRHIIRDGRRT